MINCMNKKNSTLFLLGYFALCLLVQPNPTSAQAQIETQTPTQTRTQASAEVVAEFELSPDSARVLGVRSQKMLRVDQSAGAYHPGRVQISNENRQVVTIPLAGLVTRLVVHAGDMVAQGDLLAEIASPEFLELQQQYIAVKGAYDIAAANLARDQALFEDGVISQRRMRETTTAYELGSARYNQAVQTLLINGLNQSQISAISENGLRRTLAIHAPIDGVVTGQETKVGEYHEAAQALLHISKNEDQQLTIHAPIAICEQIAGGQKAYIRGTDVVAEIMVVGCVVHDEDQGVLIRAQIIEGGQSLRPGQLVEVSIAQSLAAQGWQVPRSALVRSQGQVFAFEVTPGKVKVHRVQVLSEEPSKLVVAGNWGQDSAIAISGTAGLKSVWLSLGDD